MALIIIIVPLEVSVHYKGFMYGQSLLKGKGRVKGEDKAELEGGKFSSLVHRNPDKYYHQYIRPRLGP